MSFLQNFAHFAYLASLREIFIDAGY